MMHNERISLMKKYHKWETTLLIIELFLITFLLIAMLIIMTAIEGVFIFIGVPFTFFLIAFTHKKIGEIKAKIEKKNWVRNRLLYFIRSNKLYEESYREYEITDDNGRKRIEREQYISNSASFSCSTTDEKLIIYAHKNADNFTAKMSDLEEGLRSLFGLDMQEVLNRNTVVEYHMIIQAPERLNLTGAKQKETTDSLEINLGYGIVYDPAKCPHILVAGGTGSGKSVFISFLLIELLRRKSTVYICDPKNSDLGSLSHYLGDEKVATSPGNIARVVRLAVEEMNQRYSHMNEHFKYGSNFADHGFKQNWLVFDEMGAFQASGTNKQSKAVVMEVMEGIKQIILLGRQAGVFILVAAQQMRSETLSTDLRDNLGLRISLGNNSQEGYRMVLGSSTPETIPPIEVKGSGLLYMQGSGKASAQYYESPFVDMANFDFIAELNKYL